MNAREPVYRLEDIRHCYNRRPSLVVDRLVIDPGSITGIIGPNGSGKTTLLKVMACIEKPTAGRIFFKGEPVIAFSASIRFLTSLLTQEPYLLKRTVFDNIAYGLRIRGARKNVSRDVHQALSWVGLAPDDFSARYWNELSGGEAQRVALAARLVLKPEVLFLDEPTASVDAASAQLIKEASLRARERWGTSLVIASHDWQWLYEICDKVLHMFDGRIYSTGMENVIFGPWVQQADHHWAREAGDGQRLLVPDPSDKNAVAVIPSNAIGLYRGQSLEQHRNISLQGTVSRMILEKSSGDIVSTLMVGNIPLTIKLDQEKVAELSLRPGETIQITYRIDQVRWSR